MWKNGFARMLKVRIANAEVFITATMMERQQTF
jgi:hypothetical protein